ncbi:MAG TPA: hypothetical protein VNU68_01565 [Verrucomicrobiae bacterium]|nr:hypothetical protein [Verrucomicrobiae bacterium]
MSHPSNRSFGFCPTLASLLLGSLTLSGVLVQAGEVPIINSNFDDLAPSPAWYWETWSRAGSTVTYDANINAAGGAAGSGSLRLQGPFDPANSGWQESVFTLDLPDFDGSALQSLSFDVKVDPTSVPRAEGDYGNIQVILRNGGNWDWKQQTFIPLTSTEWTRVTVSLPAGEQPINDLRAITMRVAQNGMKGTVAVNVDNIAFNDDIIQDNFDDGNVDGWSATWQTAPELTYSTLDRYERETSGSLRVAATYFDPNRTDWQQAVITLPFPTPIDAAALYTEINLDVRVDPASMLNRDNNYGYFEVKRPDASVIGAGVNLTGNDWTHLSFPIAPADHQLGGILLQLGSGSFTGPVIYNLDNVSWTKRLAPPPPPTLSLARAEGGLNLVHTSSDQYGRHNIYSLDSSGLGFYNQIDPVSYSFTLDSFPSAAEAPNFQAHMFLVPGGPGTETSPDWNEPTLLFLDVRAGANGAGSATLRWKANQPGGNSQLYAGGLPVVNSSTVLGTWTVTASGNTHFDVRAPDGAMTSLDLASDVAALFEGQIRVYVGVQGNSPNNIGQRARLGAIKIYSETPAQEVTVLLEDDFTTDELDLSKWVINAAPGGVQMLPASEAGWLVTWTLPDDGFVLEWSTDLGDLALWNPSATVPISVGPLKRQAHIPPSELPPDSPSTFWRLTKQ